MCFAEKLTVTVFTKKLGDVILVPLLLTLTICHTFFECFCCWLWTRKCLQEINRPAGNTELSRCNVQKCLRALYTLFSLNLYFFNPVFWLIKKQHVHQICIFWKIKVYSFQNWQMCIKKLKWGRIQPIWKHTFVIQQICWTLAHVDLTLHNTVLFNIAVYCICSKE